MKVTYIYHSSFLLEDEKNIYLFDYFDGELPRFDGKKPVYCFNSHSHSDHFSEEVFDRTSYVKSKYILSKDIFKSRVPDTLSDRVLFVRPNQSLTIDNIEITTLKSTDTGVAFIIKAGDKLIYHAGDLNNWQWLGETDDYNKKMNDNYLKEMEKIKGMEFYAAFIPYDPRQDISIRAKGISDFLAYAKAKYLFPMHLWEEYDITKELYDLELDTTLMTYHKRGESFSLKED